MKINFPIGLLALSGVIAVTYFVLPIQPDEKHAIQISKLGSTNNQKTSLVKVSKSNSELVITKSSLDMQAKQVWQPIAQQQQPKTLPDNLHVEYIKVADSNSMKFSEGEKVSFLIPQENKSYVGIVNESTRAFGGDVNISSGDIENGSDHASFSVTEGENTTFITVATGESIYQVEIDNQSGVGVVLDDRELNQYRHKEDGIYPPAEGIS